MLDCSVVSHVSRQESGAGGEWQERSYRPQALPCVDLSLTIIIWRGQWIVIKQVS